MRCEPIAHREDLICVIGLLMIFFIGTFCPTIKCWMSNYFQSAKSYFSPCAHSVATRLQNRPYFLLFSPLQALFQTTLAVKALCFASLLVLFFIFVSGNIFHQDGEQKQNTAECAALFWKMSAIQSDNNIPPVYQMAPQLCSLAAIWSSASHLCLKLSLRGHRCSERTERSSAATMCEPPFVG